MQPYGTISNESVTEKYQPEKNHRFVAFVVFIIGGLIFVRPSMRWVCRGFIQRHEVNLGQ